MYRPHKVEQDINDALNVFCVFKCPFCGNYRTVTVTKVAFNSYYNGGSLAQDAFPDLSIDDRELFISGVCEECY
jgi:hypothetical protein